MPTICGNVNSLSGLVYSSFIHFGAVLVPFDTLFVLYFFILLLCLGIPWFTLVHTTGEKLVTIVRLKIQRGAAELCGIHWQLRRLWLDTSRCLSTACGAGRTAAEIEELALRCPILPTDGLMMTTTMMSMIIDHCQ